MSWVEWLKEMAEKLPGSGSEAADEPRRKPQVRTPRKGGEAYAREWVKVLEDAGPGHDPANTYTWELHPDGSPASRTGKSRRPAGRDKPGAGEAEAKAKAKRPTDPFDTYTWELQESDSPDDPWGVSAEQPPTERPVRKDGVNPYDTGVFDATWTGRFDQR